MLMSMHPLLSSIKSVDIKPINLDLLLPIIVFACERSCPLFRTSSEADFLFIGSLL